MLTNKYKHNYKNPLYNSWKDAKKRCYAINNRSYKWYGGKGIRMCEAWYNSFEQFADDMLSTWFVGATLERREIAGHYEKDNCTWIPRAEQAKNRSNVYGYWKKADEVFALLAKGYTQEEVGILTGMSQTAVSRIFRGVGPKENRA